MADTFQGCCYSVLLGNCPAKTHLPAAQHESPGKAAQSSSSICVTEAKTFFSSFSNEHTLQKVGEIETCSCNPGNNNQGISRPFSAMGNTAGTTCVAAWHSHCSISSTKGEGGYMTAYLLLASGRDCNPHTYPVSDEAEKVVVGEGARECHLHYSLSSEHSLTFR